MSDVLALAMAYQATGEVLNAKGYGLKGDDATDDTSAFLALVALAVAFKRKNLFFPPSVYHIKDAALTAAQATGLRLIGVPKQTVFKNVGGTRVLSIASGAKDFCMDGIDIDSDGGGVYVAVAHTAPPSTVYEHVFKNVRIIRLGANSNGIQYTLENTGAYFEGITFDNCEVHTGRINDQGTYSVIKLQSTGPSAGGRAARIKVNSGFYWGGANRSIFELRGVEGFQANSPEFFANWADYLFYDEIESFLSRAYHKGSFHALLSDTPIMANVRLEGIHDGAGQSYHSMKLNGGPAATASNIFFGLHCIVMPRSPIVVNQPVTDLKITGQFRACGDPTTYPVIDVQAQGTTSGMTVTGCTFDPATTGSRRIRVAGVATGFAVVGNTSAAGTDTFLDLGTAAHVSGIATGNMLSGSTAAAFSAGASCGADVKWDSTRNVYPGQAVSAGGATVLA